METANHGVDEGYRIQADHIDTTTSHHSSPVVPDKLAERIVAMGPAAIRLLLTDLGDTKSKTKSPWWRFRALRRLAEVQGLALPQVPDEAVGRLERLRQIWLAWGEMHGLV